MHLIKSCPSCKRKLRFPIDKGKIRVNCACGYSFIADPDDPAIYRNGQFDLKHGEGRGRLFFNNLKHRLSGVRFSDVKYGLINRFFTLKYTFQNLKLLSAAEQRKVFFLILAVFAIIAVIVIFII